MKIDYFTTVAPWPHDSGARLRVSALYESLLAHRFEVRLIVVGEKPQRQTRRILQAAGGCIYPGRAGPFGTRLRRNLLGVLRGQDPLAAQYLNGPRIERLGRLVAERRPDAVLLGNIYLAGLLPRLAQLVPDVPIILDNHNVESLLHRRLAAESKSLRLRLLMAISASTTRRLEHLYLRHAAQVWACSEHDAGYFRKAYRVPRVHVIPNGVDVHAFRPAAEKEKGAIVFTGFFGYPPNEAAALSLMEISARLRARGLQNTLYLVGKYPTEAMLRRARHNPGVVVTGVVTDVRPYLAKADVFAAPLEAGSGTKLKLLQAMAMGKPIITTTIGAEGLELTDGVDAIVAGVPGPFEQQLARLLQDPQECARLGDAARQHVVRHFSLEAIRRGMGQTLREMFPGARLA